MANKKIKKNLSLLIDNTIIDDLSDYELISTLGAGSFGKVLLAFHKEKGYECAIKVCFSYFFLFFIIFSLIFLIFS